MATRTKAKQAEREEALDKLRGILEPGDTVYTVLRHVSPSGMNRWIDAYKLEDDEPRWLSYLIGQTDGAGYWDDRRECVRVPGAGMDMGFHLVYSLAYALWPDGFDCTGETCPSNDHSNDHTCKREKGAHHHTESGYALNQRWM